MSGIFMHAARPADIEEGKYSDQHYFGTLRERNSLDCVQLGLAARKTSVQVLRFADRAHAILGIRSGGLSEAQINLDMNLTADQLQTLACALLDAAHALRTTPPTNQRESKEEVAA